ncbi:hypothetical protein Tco_0211921, partial [Tanacetum coccineum]
LLVFYNPTEINGIKRRQNEGLQAFMDWFKSESSHIKGVPPVLRILAFMHGYGHPELAKKLNDKIPKTVDKMFERVRAFIRGEVATRSAEMVHPSQGDKCSKDPCRRWEFIRNYVQALLQKPRCQHQVKTQKMRNFKVGFSGETYHPLGIIDLRVTMGRAGRNKTVLIEFAIIKCRSPYNVIIGRTRMRILDAVGSTIHSMIKFPTNQGIVTMETSREALWECRQLEMVQGSWKEV